MKEKVKSSGGDHIAIKEGAGMVRVSVVPTCILHMFTCAYYQKITHKLTKKTLGNIFHFFLNIKHL